MTFQREACLAWLASAELPPETLRELLEREQDPVEIYNMFVLNGKLPIDIPLSGRIQKSLSHNSAESAMNDFASCIAQNGIKVMTCFDDCYPRKLTDIPDAPVVHHGSQEGAENNVFMPDIFPEKAMGKVVPHSFGNEAFLLLQQIPAFTGDMQRQEHPFPFALQDQTEGYFFSVQAAVAQQQML